MKTSIPRPLLAVLLLAIAAPCGLAQSLPYLEDFSSGVDGLNSDAVNSSLSFNNFTYSVDGDGGVALFDSVGFLGPADLGTISGLAIFGDWNWTGTDAHNVQMFTVASNDNSTFALSALDFMTGDGGAPTVFTITGYRGEDQVAQIVDLNLMFDGTYGAMTNHEIIGTYLVGEPYFGLHLVFSGSNWSNIDRFTFVADGIDILVILDNIQFSPASVIPEPATSAVLLGFGTLGLVALRRRTRTK